MMDDFRYYERADTYCYAIYSYYQHYFHRFPLAALRCGFFISETDRREKSEKFFRS
ncbi:Uncharacterised protein [Escherichia coli]|nr:Uncharacterised protein [Escherichia coli]SQN86477.1 Uncharacterised protein [Escherichia coli]SQS59981.1 Uncharacterised protein [Escherichia coli]SQS67485.1 Uncharacterised protein [Escherichia coli]SQS86767.1 Uncharacterised protein [Escherichia coli]